MYSIEKCKNLLSSPSTFSREISMLLLFIMSSDLRNLVLKMFARIIKMQVHIVKPKSEVPKSKVPKSRPKELGLTLKSQVTQVTSESCELKDLNIN